MSEAFKDELTSLMYRRHGMRKAPPVWRDLPHSSAPLLKPSSLAPIPYKQLV